MREGAKNRAPIKPCSFEYPISGGRTNCGNIAVQHHESEPAITFQRVLASKLDDGRSLLWFDPMVARNHGVVFIGFTIAIFPSVELAWGEPQPEKQPHQSQSGELMVVLEKIHHPVAQIVRHPLTLQLSPSSFFVRTKSSMISAMISSLRRNLLSSASSLRSF